MVVPSLFLLEFPSDCLVKERADGKPLAWIGITQRNRQKLKTEDKTQCPWSCRDSVRKRGISVQLSSLNFVDELLDIKFMQECERLLITFDSSAPFHLFADIRQDTNYQLRSGSVSMLSGSRIYHYASDRCLVGAEHMAMNGWGKDWSDEDLTIDIIGKIQSECLGIPCKKKKGKAGEPDIAIAKFAGNAKASRIWLCLRCLSSMCLTFLSFFRSLLIWMRFLRCTSPVILMCRLNLTLTSLNRSFGK